MRIQNYFFKLFGLKSDLFYLTSFKDSIYVSETIILTIYSQSSTGETAAQNRHINNCLHLSANTILKNSDVKIFITHSYDFIANA